MSNKSLSILFIILFIGVILHQVMIASGMSVPGMTNLRWIETLFFLSGIYLLLKNGTFIKSTEGKLTLGAIALLLIGAMFKMMHWPFANEMLIVGFGSMAGFYTTHFFNKPEKEILDYGKVLFVFLFLMGMLFRIMHWPFGMEMQMLGLLSFLLTVSYFIWKNKLLRI